MPRKTTDNGRARVFIFRLTEDEDGWLRELSELTGLSMSDVIRQAIRQQHREKIESKISEGGHTGGRLRPARDAMRVHAKKHPRAKP